MEAAASAAARPAAPPRAPPAPAASVFLRGELLDAVARSAAARGGDSKAFVDRPVRGALARAPGCGGALEREFAALRAAAEAAAADGTGGGDFVAEFVARRFDEPGADLERATPDDWDESAAPVPPRASPAGAYLARYCHSTWPALCLRASPCVAEEPLAHTLLPLPRTMVVPGDRFRESYYWDSYWIVRGLLASGMGHTAEGVVENLVSLVERFGFVPNGGRAYYANRSQPPLLAAMVAEVWAARKRELGAEWLARALRALYSEHAWLTAAPRQVVVAAEPAQRGSGGGALHTAATDGGAQHALCRYWADWDEPRPESYLEDVRVGERAGLRASSPDWARLMREIAATAASGWDFSARWTTCGTGELSQLRTTRTLPADLNAFMLLMERTVAALAGEAGDAKHAAKFQLLADARQRAMDAVLWDERGGRWRDAVLEGDGAGTSAHPSRARWCTDAPRSASDYVPLWCGAAAAGSDRALAVVRSLAASGLVCRNGVATTDKQSGEQWDWPNVWPPIQHMLAEGLNRCGHEEGRQLGASLATRWLRATARTLERTGAMHEKLDAVSIGGAVGRGGEYVPQVGFGWTNAAALLLLQQVGGDV